MEEALSIHMASCPPRSLSLRSSPVCREGLQPWEILHTYYRDQMREQMLKRFVNIDHFTVWKWDHFLKISSQKPCLLVIKNMSIVLLDSFKDSSIRSLQPLGPRLVPSTGYLELGHTAGGEWWAGVQSSICCSPSLPITHITPEPPPTPIRENLSSMKLGSWCQKCFVLLL